MAALIQYQCPCCSGKIEFDSESQQMKCPYCDTMLEVESLKGYDDALKHDQTDELKWQSAGGQWQEGETDGMAVYQCSHCGGEIVCEQTTAATSCPFCGNPVVMAGQFSGDLRPDYVIPFQLNREKAKEALLAHLQGKRLLPKAFREDNRIDEIKGIYVPYWLFDTDAEARIRYRATKVRHSSDANYYYTHTRHYAVLREGKMGFAKVPADGSTKMADDLMESLEPYDFSKAVDFQTAYLAGYLADRYDVPAEACEARVNERIKASIEKAFADTVTGYSSVSKEQSAIRYVNGTVKYALFPVWILNTTWNGEKYTFAMNGQTGKFVGDLPMDKGAYWKWLGGLTGACSAAALGIISLIWWLA